MRPSFLQKKKLGTGAKDYGKGRGKGRGSARIVEGDDGARVRV